MNYRKLGLLLLVIVIVIYWNQLATSLLPFALAFVFAASIEPIISSLQDRIRLPRPVAVFITLAALILIAGYSVSVVLAKVAAELVDLAGKLPLYQRQVVSIAETLIVRLNELYEYLPAQVSDYLQSTIDDLSRTAVVVMGDMIDRTLRTITGLPSLMIVLIVTVLATYFLSRDRDQLADSLLRFAPVRWQAPLRDAQEKIVVDLIGFLKAQLVIFVIITAIAAAGLFYIGTHYWVILGIVLGILDLIPIVGPGLVIFPWAGVSILMEDVRQAVLLVLLFVAILAVRQTAQAKVLGDSIGVHPLTMLIAVYGGIVIFGIKGVILGPVLVIVGKALWASGLLPVVGDDAEGLPSPSEPQAESGTAPPSTVEPVPPSSRSGEKSPS